LSFRNDIQALRGLAVLLVVFYHAALLPVPAGYLGVDIFFVISGFLITTQISQQLQTQSFSFKEFYLRRAWRLLPAAYTVFAVCIALSPWLLTQIELVDFQEQLFGAISFTANIVLWTQTGYFEQAAELKPLLHTWSLSIEEQYYLIMPALLAILVHYKISRLWFVSALTVLSCLLFYVSYSDMPGASFYLTPTRVWELGIGSVLALFLQQKNKSANTHLASKHGYFALLLIIVFCFHLLPENLIKAIELQQLHVLVVTLATAVLISTRLYFLNQGPIANCLSAIGSISYSLYLVHWPILAFLNSANVSGEELWWVYKLGAVVLSIILSAILYLFIEKRFRITLRTHNRRFLPLMVLSLLLIVAAFSLNLMPKEKRDYQHELRVSVGLSLGCNDKTFSAKSECRTNETPELLLWGDSYAMHIAPALENNPNGLMQAAKLTCGPTNNLSLYAPPKHNRDDAQKCIEFNQAVKKYALNQSNSIELVVLAMQWDYLLDSDTLLKRSINDNSQNSFSIVETERSAITESLTQLIIELQDANKKIVIVEAPPSAGFNIGRCIERDEQKKWLHSQKNCKVPLNKYKRLKTTSLILYATLKRLNVPIYSFVDKLCNETECDTTLNGSILYRDYGHLSYSGARQYQSQFKMLEEIYQLAGLKLNSYTSDQ